MMQGNHFLRSIFCFLALQACDTAVTGDDLFTEDQLVVINGAISPQDSILKIRVSNSSSAIMEADLENNAIKDAIVSLSNSNQNTVFLEYTPTEFNYQIPATEFPVFPNERYYLKVVVNGNTFSANCTIPENQIESLTYEISDNNKNSAVDEPTLTISFVDIPNKTNHYIIGAEAQITYPNSFTFKKVLDYGNERFASNTVQDGQRITAIGSGLSDFAGFEVQIQVANVEEILFQSLYTSYINRKNTENPFFDPIIPPNNIAGKGGWGVFSGFQLFETTVLID